MNEWVEALFKWSVIFVAAIAFFVALIEFNDGVYKKNFVTDSACANLQTDKQEALDRIEEAIDDLKEII